MSEELEEELDSQNQDAEDAENTEEVEEVDSADADETEDERPKYTETEMKMYARAKKAEAEQRRLKKLLQEKAEAKPKPSIKQDPGLSEELIDEKILRSQGLDDDAIEEAKYIAGRKGISLLAATHDERFIRYTKEAEEEKRKAEASVGASRGSQRKTKTPDFTDPNLSPEEHEALWKKQMGL